MVGDDAKANSGLLQSFDVITVVVTRIVCVVELLISFCMQVEVGLHPFRAMQKIRIGITRFEFVHNSVSIVSAFPLPQTRMRMANQSTLLFRRHRLPLHTFKRWVQTSPTRCARNPNVHIRLNRGRLIQVARTNHPELWTVGGLGEQMCAAFRAKLTSDLIATVGDLRVLRKHPGKAESVCGDKQIHRPIRREVLAVAAPANTGG